MIMGGRRSREAEHQAERLRDPRIRPGPRLPALARFIMSSRAFQRLMEHLDTREGARPGELRFPEQPAPCRPSDRVLPDKGQFAPRMHPLGGLVFRTRLVQRLLGHPLSAAKAVSSTTGDAPSSAERDRGDTEECGSPGGEARPSEGDEPVAPHQATALTDTEIRDIRQKALISSLLHSASRREEAVDRYSRQTGPGRPSSVVSQGYPSTVGFLRLASRLGFRT